jgi:predicted DNA-binding transcriptional regulator YafY
LPEQKKIKELSDGGLLLSSHVMHNAQILPLVRYWIPYIKIVSPEYLQDEMENELRHYVGGNENANSTEANESPMSTMLCNGYFYA